MSEQFMLQRMVRFSIAGLILCTLLCFLLDPGRFAIGIASYLLGAFPALIGFLLICLQFRIKAELWVWVTMLGYAFRLVLYGSAIVLLFMISGNILTFFAGLIVPKLGLLSLSKGR